MRAGLSRRQLGWRGDLCAGVPAAPGAGVPLFRLIEQHLEEFLRVYPERFAKQHGPLRPVVERLLRGFLTCGLVEHGFARLWCPTCRTSVRCPFSCRGRSFCPSCEKKSSPIQWHPHGHLLITDGAFSDDGTFHPVESWDAEAVMKLFRERLLSIDRRKPR